VNGDIEARRAALRARFPVWEPVTLSGFLARSSDAVPAVLPGHRAGQRDQAGLGAAAKRLVWSGLGTRVEAQLPEEARKVSELSGTADAREGLAAVIERRPPVFRGH
jgi:hypothetical protein